MPAEIAGHRMRRYVNRTTDLRSDEFFQDLLVANSQRGAFEHGNLPLAEVGEDTGYGLARGTNDLGNLFVGEGELDLGFGLVVGGGRPLQQQARQALRRRVRQ